MRKRKMREVVDSVEKGEKLEEGVEDVSLALSGDFFLVPSLELSASLFLSLSCSWNSSTSSSTHRLSSLLD